MVLSAIFVFCAFETSLEEFFSSGVTVMSSSGVSAPGTSLSGITVTGSFSSGTSSSGMSVTVISSASSSTVGSTVSDGAAVISCPMSSELTVSSSGIISSIFSEHAPAVMHIISKNRKILIFALYFVFIFIADLSFL